jgi:hypothetical protein
MGARVEEAAGAAKEALMMQVLRRIRQMEQEGS